MNRDEIIETEVYGTESGKKLFEMLSKVFRHKENIENVIYLLETEENRQAMIKFLEKGNKTVDEIHYYTVELSNKKELKIVCNVGKQVQLKEINEKVSKILQLLDDTTQVSLSVNTDDTLDKKEIKIAITGD